MQRSVLNGRFCFGALNDICCCQLKQPFKVWAKMVSWTHNKTTVAAAAAGLAAIGAWYALAGAPGREAPADVDLKRFAGAGPLDGKVFTGQLGPTGKPADVADTWVFSRGMFVSKECERRCNYPPRPYFTRLANGKTEFFSETRCPGKDAKLVWRGTVANGRVEGVMTWTVSRWYWTIEKQFSFSGLVRDRASPLARK